MICTYLDRPSRHRRLKIHKNDYNHDYYRFVERAMWYVLDSSFHMCKNYYHFQELSQRHVILNNLC